MRYNQWLKKKNGGKCPFCTLTNEMIVASNKNADIILSRARYGKDHLLVVPKKHVDKLSKLTIKQREDLEELMALGLKKLHKKYVNVSVVYREGTLKGVGKSVVHAHFHLIPNKQIKVANVSTKRRFFSEKTYVRKTKEMKEELFT